MKAIHQSIHFKLAAGVDFSFSCYFLFNLLKFGFVVLFLLQTTVQFITFVSVVFQEIGTSIKP